MAGRYITVTAKDGGSFKAYLATPEKGSGPGHRAAAGDFRHQRLYPRRRRLLRRGRLCRAGAGPVLAHRARHRAGLRRRGPQEGLCLSREIRRRQSGGRYRRHGRGAAPPAGMQGQDRRHRLLPRRAAGLSQRGAARHRLRRLLLRRRHREGAGRSGEDQMPDGAAHRREGQMDAARGGERDQMRASKAAPRSRSMSIPASTTPFPATAAAISTSRPR